MAGFWLDAGLLVGLMALLYAAARPERVFAGRRGAGRQGAGRRGTGRGSAAGQAATQARQQLTERLTGFYRRLARQAGVGAGARQRDQWLIKLGGAVMPPLVLLDQGVGGYWPWLAAVAGFFLPDLWLVVLRRRRRRLISQSLPYFLDLVVAFLHSGLSLVEAFRRAGREAFAGSHPLAREVELIGSELDAGRDPSVAMRDLAERTGVADLRAVAAALRVGMRLGAPIRETLLAQADGLLIKRREDALRRIHRAELQMMFPVMLSGFPVFIVLVFFPIIMDIVDAYRRAVGLLQ